MFNLSIYTLEKTLFEDGVVSVVVPGVDGELGVLTNHIPLVTPLKKGRVKIKKTLKPERYEKSEILFIEIEKGFLEVRPEGAVILAEI